jgi:hypothetical protein
VASEIGVEILRADGSGNRNLAAAGMLLCRAQSQIRWWVRNGPTASRSNQLSPVEVAAVLGSMREQATLVRQAFMEAGPSDELVAHILPVVAHAEEYLKVAVREAEALTLVCPALRDNAHHAREVLYDVIAYLEEREPEIAHAAAALLAVWQYGRYADRKLDPAAATRSLTRVLPEPPLTNSPVQNKAAELICIRDLKGNGTTWKELPRAMAAKGWRRTRTPEAYRQMLRRSGQAA